jgi:hypothetical protein
MILAVEMGGAGLEFTTTGWFILFKKYVSGETL